MALTESQKLKIAKILGVTYIEVHDKATYLGSTHLTTEVETQIGEELDRWELKGAKFTKIKDYLGADIDPEREKDDIRKNLATLLYFTDLMKSSNGATSRVQRG